ncbi:MAG: TIGR03915 family putative DNA repair protein [Clostridiales Family XIII bacterium]|jgi:probable DNA metabolism protein|nr:TIGR03915 family putative DNA repair protein [Clostridiales Family XIII bacterium]
MNYIYDGTFGGFLSCVYEHYYSAKADGIFVRGAYQADMLVAPCEVRTDEGRARRVEAAIEEKISPHALARVYRVFRTDTDGKEMLLLNYIRFCFKSGPGVAFLHSHPLVNPVARAELKIGNEVHRLCGLIRFSAVCPAPPASAWHGGAEAMAAQTREILYARVEPDHDVLEFLAPHFTDRFKSEPFIIHDTRRGRALIAWHRRWHIEDFTERDAALFENTAGEKGYRDMWRRYFDAIAIKERANPRCQRNFMPARYWQNLTEMQP